MIQADGKSSHRLPSGLRCFHHSVDTPLVESQSDRAGVLKDQGLSEAAGRSNGPKALQRKRQSHQRQRAKTACSAFAIRAALHEKGEHALGQATGLGERKSERPARRETLRWVIDVASDIPWMKSGFGHDPKLAVAVSVAHKLATFEPDSLVTLCGSSKQRVHMIVGAL
ncbi:MAG: hypothetical protein AAGG48_29665 [Planctomycetota bacterium]